MTSSQNRQQVKEILLGGATGGTPRPELHDNDIAAPLLTWSDTAVWDVWARPELPMKTRSIVTVVAMIMLNRPVLLRTHLRGALRTGNSAAEIREVLLHLAPYVGIPAASDAMSVFLSVLDEYKAEEAESG